MFDPKSLSLRVLHVVATDQRRGAEIFASDLVRALNEKAVAQRVAVLRGAEPLALRFDAPVSLLPSDETTASGVPIRLRTLRAISRLIRAGGPMIEGCGMSSSFLLACRFGDRYA
jgi:hypothetical protein